MTSGIPAARYPVRLAGARREAARAGLDALLIGVGADLRYLTGYNAHANERITLLVLPVAEDAPATLVVPRLEATPARSCAAAAAGAVEIATWEETEDPMLLVAARLEAATGRGAHPWGPRPCRTTSVPRSSWGFSGSFPAPGSPCRRPCCGRSACGRTRMRSRCCARRRTPRTA